MKTGGGDIRPGMAIVTEPAMGTRPIPTETATPPARTVAAVRATTSKLRTVDFIGDPFICSFGLWRRRFIQNRVRLEAVEIGFIRVCLFPESRYCLRR